MNVCSVWSEAHPSPSVSENLATALKPDKFSETEIELKDMVKTAIELEDVEATNSQTRPLDKDSLYSDDKMTNFPDIESSEAFEIKEQKEFELVAPKNLNDLVFSQDRSVSAQKLSLSIFFACHKTKSFWWVFVWFAETR